MTNANDPAYPTGEETNTGLVQGLTKREVMAKDFMAAIIASGGDAWTPQLYARLAIGATDELIKQLNSTDQSEITVGDKVRVNDPGLLMLQKFAPPGAKPNNEGIVHEIMEDGDLLIHFPIGDDYPEEHPQASVYPASICQKIQPKQ